VFKFDHLYNNDLRNLRKVLKEAGIVRKGVS